MRTSSEPAIIVEELVTPFSIVVTVLKVLFSTTWNKSTTITKISIRIFLLIMIPLFRTLKSEHSQTMKSTKKTTIHLFDPLEETEDDNLSDHDPEPAESNHSPPPPPNNPLGLNHPDHKYHNTPSPNNDQVVPTPENQPTPTSTLDTTPRINPKNNLNPNLQRTQQTFTQNLLYPTPRRLPLAQFIQLYLHNDHNDPYRNPYRQTETPIPRIPPANPRNPNFNLNNSPTTPLEPLSSDSSDDFLILPHQLNMTEEEMDHLFEEQAAIAAQRSLDPFPYISEINGMEDNSVIRIRFYED
ncbi:hypothetical protein LIER_32436 [Lithospermum erythrorhizon]|uniref:Uncharacterized protein n=1 Tax=Lithospermum erythrorhizon TaxID=34254 RepID=A0AAV3RTV8_LITER